MVKQTENTHIQTISPLLSPDAIKQQVPVTEKATATVLSGRQDIQNILSGDDNRLLLVIGPCSIHDPKAALEYAKRLQLLSEQVRDKLCIIMRVYFEKPRTTLGWKGLINDPDMNQSYQIEKGLTLAREVLRDINELGLPTASEMLDTIIPQYISDLVSWASLGARTTESQPHREMASGLSMPVGFKNATNGDTSIAMNAMKVALHPHRFVGTDVHGHISAVHTKGNPYGHLILRGGATGPNFDPITIQDCVEKCSKQGLSSKIMIDCSHGNSLKKHQNQARVFTNVLAQVQQGNTHILGCMLESNLNEGNQSIPDHLDDLSYGVSVTDECMGWETTERLVQDAYRLL